jgi:hypothetical protein
MISLSLPTSTTAEAILLNLAALTKVATATAQTKNHPAFSAPSVQRRNRNRTN